MAAAMTAPPSRSSAQTFAIVVIVLVAINLRPGIVSIGPILPLIRSEFGLSNTAAALLTAIPDLLMGLLALPTPWLARRFGRNAVVLTALIVLCASIIARAFAPSVTILLISTAGVGAGIAVSGALIAGFIKGKFPTRAAMMMGIYATALSLGSTISAGATGPLSAIGTWRLGSGIWGALGIVGVIAWGLLARRESDGAKGAQTVMHKLPLRDPIAWRVALFFACDNLLFYALLTWTSPLYQEHGYSSTRAGLVLAGFTAAFMCASPVFGWLSKSEDRRGWLALAGVLALAGLVPTALAPGLAPFVFIPLCAFGLGAAFTLGMTLPLDNTRSVQEANVWNAFVLTVGYLVAATGPLLVGTLRDMTGGFGPALWLLVAVALLMLGLTPFLKPTTRN